MRRLATALLALSCLGTGARAEPLRAEVEALVRRQLAGVHLTRAQIDRLLREPRVEAALTDLFDGWDGIADEVRIERRPGPHGELVVQTLIAERRCLAHLDLGPEVGPSQPVCDEVVRPDGERMLSLDDDLWRAPAKPPSKPRSAPPSAVADLRPAPIPEPPAPTGPVDNTVLRRPKSLGELEVGPVAEARADHQRLRDRIKRPHYKDPFLPADAIEAGEALRPVEANEPAVEARVDQNLRNPFDEARMRTALPVPDMLTLQRTGGVEPLVPAEREECVAEWNHGAANAAPPTLDCYRRVAWRDCLEDNDAYTVLSSLASVLQLPLLDTILTIVVKDEISHQAHRLVWALVWIEWVKDHPERTQEALTALTQEERRLLRRRLADWWVEGKLGELRPTITRLFERHFLGLYPEATDLDGLPRRAFVGDTWIWANNWLAILDGRGSDDIAAAYERLSLPERRVIGAFVHDRDLARRWSRAAEVIAGL